LLLVLGAVVCWSGLGVMVNLLYALGADPLWVVLLRVALAAGLLTAALTLWRPRSLLVPRGRLVGLFVYGLLGVAVNMACFLYALQHTTVTTAVVIAYAHPAMVVLLARLVFAEPLNRHLLAALLLTSAGVFLVAEGYNPAALRLNFTGIGFALGNAMGIASFNVLGKRLVRGMDSWTVLVYGLLFGGAVLAAVWAAAGAPAAPLPAEGWLLVLGLALIPSILAYALYLQALKRLAAGRAAIAASLEPVLASLLAWIALGERITPLQAAGAALVLSGVFVIRSRRGTTGAPPPQRG